MREAEALRPFPDLGHLSGAGIDAPDRAPPDIAVIPDSPGVFGAARFRRRRGETVVRKPLGRVRR